jgi:hypothetical protein
MIWIELIVGALWTFRVGFLLSKYRDVISEQSNIWLGVTCST